MNSMDEPLNFHSNEVMIDSQAGQVEGFFSLPEMPFFHAGFLLCRALCSLVLQDRHDPMCDVLHKIHRFSIN